MTTEIAQQLIRELHTIGLVLSALLGVFVTHITIQAFKD